MRPRSTSRLAEEAEGRGLRPSMRQKAGHEVVLRPSLERAHSQISEWSIDRALANRQGENRFQQPLRISNPWQSPS
jgi:hypothetical protein